MRQWLPGRLTGIARLGGAKGTKITGAALAVILLLAGWMAGLLLFFPTAAVENRIETEVTTRMRGQGHLDLAGLSLRLPLGLSVRQATLHLNRSPVPEISVADLSVKPLWLSLLSGNPGLAFECRIMGGRAAGTLRRKGDIGLELRQVRFVLPVLKNSSIEVAGTLEEGDLAVHWPPVENSKSHLSLIIDQARVTGLDSVGATDKELGIGTIVLQGNGTGNSFKLERLESRDGQLILAGGGAVLLANPIDKSRVNLSGTLKPGPGLSPQLRDLLGVVAREVDGSFPFAISGTLARPMIK